MKIIQKDIFFHELCTNDIVDKTVILDIDGTLMCSSQMNIDTKVKAVITALQQKNIVYVFSNNYNGKRSREIAKNIPLPYIEAPHKKPNTKILNYIDDKKHPIVAIGDKYLTDGLFAQFAGAEHIRVKRYKCGNDSIADRIACLLDDIIYVTAKLIGIVK